MTASAMRGFLPSSPRRYSLNPLLLCLLARVSTLPDGLMFMTRNWELTPEGASRAYSAGGVGWISESRDVASMTNLGTATPNVE
jgi:hypothetical protein